MLNISKHIKKVKQLGLVSFPVEESCFDLLPLTDELAEVVANKDTYDDALKLAAIMGISSEYQRVYDDEESHHILESLWDLPEIKAADEELDPCVMYRVGEKVCEITDNELLTEMINELRSRVLVDGDNLDISIPLAQVQADNAAAVA